MTCLVVQTRDELAALWLPWCVDRGRQYAIVKIDERLDLRERAMQLRVGDLADSAVRQALGTQRRQDSRTSLQAIEELAGHARSRAAGGTVVHDAAEAFLLPDGPMLHEGCHRACALYDSQIEAFEVRARVDPIFGPWAIYLHPDLRARDANRPVSTSPDADGLPARSSLRSRRRG